jgi:hypothetical protein
VGRDELADDLIVRKLANAQLEVEPPRLGRDISSDVMASRFALVRASGDDSR